MLNFNLPYLSPNIRYNFKVNIDQFGKKVMCYFYDKLEILAIKEFEKHMLKMVKADPNRSYTMIELGSNQAYYSLMFHAILKKFNSNPTNILIEAREDHIDRGINQFKINGFDVKSKLCSIGTLEKVVTALRTYWPKTTAKDLSHFSSDWVTLTDIFEEFNLDYLDVLHCDIDFCEMVLFETAEEIFKQKKIKYIFLSTHGQFHELSLKFLKECGYEILLNNDHTCTPVGYDTFIIAKGNIKASKF